MTIILLWERPTDERIQKIALSPVTSWALCGLLLTASKPLIYLRFLKSYNYTPTKTASFLPENWRLLTLCAYRTHRAKCSTAIVKPPMRCFYYTPHWRFTQSMGWPLWLTDPVWQLE